MRAFRARLLTGITVALATIATTAAGAGGAGTLVATGTHPRPPAEGPPGPPARLPDGNVARPPRVSSAQISAGCPAPRYGPRFYAPGRGKTVALTFDDGPGASTAAILGVLRADGAPATFFNLGQNMAARPSLVRREAAAGFLLGNHTWSHPFLPGLSAAGQAAQLDGTSAEQRRLLHRPPCVFRPPYGSYNATTLRLANRRRMAVWLWSVDTGDWKARGSGASFWVNRIVSLAEREGRGQRHPVVLMHNQPAGNPATVRALPRIISFFRRHHYTFVTLSGVLAGWGARQASQAAAQANGRVDVFYRGTDSLLHHTWYSPGSGWRGPVTMGKARVSGEPSVVASVEDRVDVFWRGADGKLWHLRGAPGYWRREERLGMGRLTGSPAAVSQASGVIDVFWRGAGSNHLISARYRPGGGWSGPADLGGDVTSTPSPAASSPGRVDVFWQGGRRGTLWHAYRAATSPWHGPYQLGMGVLGSAPHATGQASGVIDVFWRGQSGHLRHARYNPGTGWYGPQDLGGRLGSAPFAVTSSQRTVSAFWRGPAGQLWRSYRSGTGRWHGPYRLAMGTLGSTPWAGGQPDGTIEVFWRGSGGGHHLRHARRSPGTGWRGPGDLGGHLAPAG